MTKFEELMTDEYLNETFRIDTENGLVFWKERPAHHFKNETVKNIWNAKCAGKPAGGQTEQGYFCIWFRVAGMRRHVLAHRLIWRMATGRWAYPTIDHKDCNPANNRIGNLREATYADQNANRPSRRAGPKGATYDQRTGRYVAQISRDGKNTFLGRFDSEADAHAAYMAAAKQIHGEFAKA